MIVWALYWDQFGSVINTTVRLVFHVLVSGKLSSLKFQILKECYDRTKFAIASPYAVTTRLVTTNLSPGKYLERRLCEPYIYKSSGKYTKTCAWAFSTKVFSNTFRNVDQRLSMVGRGRRYLGGSNNSVKLSFRHDDISYNVHKHLTAYTHINTA